MTRRHNGDEQEQVIVKVSWSVLVA